MKKVITSAVVILLTVMAGIAFGAMLSKDRATPMRAGTTINIGVAASTKIYTGGMVAVNASGYAVPAAPSISNTIVGKSEEYVDNSSGVNAAKTINIGTGIYRFDNGIVANAVADDDIGKIAYAFDDHTVWVHNNSGTLPPAGRVYDVDSSGVWIDFRGNFALGAMSYNHQSTGIRSSHKVVWCNTTASETDSDSIVTEGNSGIAATDIVIGVINSSANTVGLLKATASTGYANFLFNGVGGANTTVNFCVYNAVVK